MRLAAAYRVFTRPLCTKFRVYTRTGDAGASSLFNGQRKAKNHLVFSALGDSDEVTAPALHLSLCPHP